MCECLVVFEVLVGVLFDCVDDEVVVDVWYLVCEFDVIGGRVGKVYEGVLVEGEMKKWFMWL